MAGWVGALSPGAEGNWQICKEHRLWGTGSGSGRSVDVGDELFIWLSKAGWIARCAVVAEARPVTSTADNPWPQTYAWVMPIEVLQEPATPIRMRPRQLQEDFGLRFMNQFKRVEGRELIRLRGLFVPPAAGE